ncbi:MAG: roadblock/LC7 domain-containing protein [Candidatus Thermoplasmatota archaeon]|nr:roadblock/LC7 domain-containing protein [Candidatus Thermoplasmatota archaeon]
MQHKRYKTILNTLASTVDIEHSFIVSRDGLLIAPESCQGLNPHAFAAMAATLLGAAEAAVDELRGGVPAHVAVHTKNFTILVMGAGPRALLAVVTTAEQMDSVIDAMQTAAKELGTA